MIPAGRQEKSAMRKMFIRMTCLLACDILKREKRRRVLYKFKGKNSTTSKDGLSMQIENEIEYQGKLKDFYDLPKEKQILVKDNFIPIDRIKDEIAVLMKKHSEDRHTIVSFLLSTMLNNIGKKKNGYTFGNFLV